ncbi:PAS domain S-box protein [Nakamurella sp.]|uniref:PAS domain S-box protein n=1 Tax=Nakamurella sp. TaxID=1869182 RepID=UPI003B3AF418
MRQVPQAREVARSTSERPDRPAVAGEPAFLQSVVAMFVVDRTRTIVAANRAAHDLLGLGELCGQVITDFYPPESAAQARTNAARLRSGAVSHYEREGEMISATGDRLIVQIRVDPLPDDGGDGLRLVQMRDVTDIRRHEQALAASERMYRDVVQTLPHCTVVSFDKQLRALVIGGDLSRQFVDGPDGADAVLGRPLREVIPEVVLLPMEESIRAALRGHATDIDYACPYLDARYRVRGRALTAPDGRVVGGMVLSEDVSRERIRQAQLEQTQELSHVGTCRFDIGAGWAFDAKLLTLIGAETTEEGLRLVDELIVPADRERVRADLTRVFTGGGRATMEYRMQHGRTGELRHVRAVCDAQVDSAGTLLRAVITHADITEVVYSRRTVEAARLAVAQARTDLLRRISDLLAGDRPSPAGQRQRITDVVMAGMGDGAVLTIRSPDGPGVETDCVAHADPAARELLRAALIRPAGDADPVAPPAAGPAGPAAARWADAHQVRCTPAVERVVAQILTAPVRHAGAVLGVLSVVRGPGAPLFVPEDADLLHLLAARVGAAVSDERARSRAERHRLEHTLIADRLVQLDAEQRALIDQLAEVEERERVLLAEAIHDDPMQLIIAVAMRLETLGLRSGEPPAEFEELIGNLEVAVERLRTLMAALNPPAPSEGLGAALRRLADGIFVGTRTSVRWSGADHVPLDVARKQAAYRILREALVNARKHACASTVDLALTHDDAAVVVTVVDDGRGTDRLDSTGGRLGMVTMRARAAAEGCSLTVSSEPGRGTTVRLAVPLVPPPADRAVPPAPDRPAPA